jgi:hypothetical protein
LIISGIALQFSIVQGQIELGMGAGMSVYRGEIGAHTAASNYVNANVAHGKLSTQGFAKFSILPGVKLRANVGFSEYAAFDKYSRDAFFQQRNLSLNGKILDGGLMVEYYPLPQLPVYFTTGIKYGMISYSVKNASGEVINLTFGKILIQFLSDKARVLIECLFVNESFHSKTFFLTDFTLSPTYLQSGESGAKALLDERCSETAEWTHCWSCPCVSQNCRSFLSFQ